ncbi:MAG: hypothetical protein ATN32_04580 [Candidatus Epulonipiscium fishelsonii]|nr:MAG: hypothetical protein ATN32_04580 [Epulopiscium sp. AS2M-Bin002]
MDLLGIWDSVENIDFENLPKKFVLKCTHGCGYNIICRDKEKLNIQQTKKQLNIWMKEDYGKKYSESHYSKIKPTIICEKYIDGLSDGQLPIDYKIHCSKGKVLFILCIVREDIIKKQIVNKNFMEISNSLVKTEITFEAIKPKSYESMIKIAEEISQKFNFIRIDFYDLNGKLILGELTFTPAGGKLSYLNKNFGMYIGNKLKI